MQLTEIITRLIENYFLVPFLIINFGFGIEEYQTTNGEK